MSDDELNALARAVIDANRYMALGTADEAGHPWVSPVWFASQDYRRFHWVSSPEARHSRNLENRPEVAIAIFDSSVPIGGAQAVYISGMAAELTDAELQGGIDVFSRLSQLDGGRRWGVTDVQPPASLRLFRATASEHFVLIPGQDPERGSGVDRRERVTLD